MTFKEELIQISDKYDIASTIANHCCMIKEYMLEAARAGFRTFMIEISTTTKITDIGANIPKNYYFVKMNHDRHMKCAAESIKDFLVNDLGFDDSALYFAEHTSIRLSVRW